MINIEYLARVAHLVLGKDLNRSLLLEGYGMVQIISTADVVAIHGCSSTLPFLRLLYQAAAFAHNTRWMQCWLVWRAIWASRTRVMTHGGRLHSAASWEWGRIRTMLWEVGECWKVCEILQVGRSQYLASKTISRWKHLLMLFLMFFAISGWWLFLWWLLLLL